MPLGISLWHTICLSFKETSMAKPRHMASATRPATYMQEMATKREQIDESSYEQGISPDLTTAIQTSDGDPSSAESIGKSAALMSVLVIISRITGFLRTWGQVFAMGVTVTASCYTVANNLPNQLYELVMGGMLVTAFLPVYLSVKRDEGREAANLYTSNLISLVFLIMGAVCLLGIIFASQVVWTQSFGANHEFDHGLAVYFFRFFAIEVVLYALSTIVSGVLNAERDYLMSSAAPIFNNVVVTASFFLYAFLLPHNMTLALLVLALGNPLGVLIQVLIQLPSLKRHGVTLKFYVDVRDVHLKETLSIGVPSLIVTVVMFVTVSVQTSSALSVSVAGSSIAYYTRLWYTLPYSILAIPITTAMFTELSERVSHHDMDGYVRGVILGSSEIAFFLIPCALLLIVFARPLIVILAAGKLSQGDIAMTVSYLRTLSLSLPFFGICTYLQKVCSSLRKMKVFAVANVIAGIIQVAFCLALTPVFGLNIVALSSLFFFIAVDVVTFVTLKTMLPQLRPSALILSSGKSLLLGVAGSAVGMGLLQLLSRSAGDIGLSVGKSFLYCLAAGLPALLVVFAMAVAVNMEEAVPLKSMLSRFRRA